VTRKRERRVLGSLIDGTLDSLGAWRERLGESFEPVLRLGVTGLSGAGKTVFITALVANLLDRGRMGQVAAHRDGRIEMVALRPHPDRGVPRFDYEAHRAALSSPQPHWPQSTRAVSQLRLSIRYRPTGWLSGLGGASMLHLDIVDYPGEWLLDLPLLDLDYAAWSAKSLAQARTPLRSAHAEAWLGMIGLCDPDAVLDEGEARRLAEAYTAYLNACRKAGLAGMTPGRFLLPGELEGSPALTFSPLPPAKGRRGSLSAEFARRYEAYRRLVVRPFFQHHFATLDRQIVLVDLLGALDAGPGAVGDLRAAMVDILTAFRPGVTSWLGSLLGAHRIDRILFAATKADHVHHDQHPRMAAILKALLRESVDRAAFRGATVESLAIASLRATVEQEVRRNGSVIPCVRGRLAATGREAALHPGDLPEDPQTVLAEARADAARDAGWLGGDYEVMQFLPPAPGGRPGDGPPHIRLDRAFEFLVGDRLA
jgi:predicted YcjX-like family ATPase